jgi:4-hydroxy-3-methylbut-2-enyl diphosphate reductase
MAPENAPLHPGRNFMQVILANPRGFCAGVKRAIAIVERVIEKFDAPIHVRHEVVHNRFVCDDLRSKGAIFIENLSEVPEGRAVIFSAHGVARAVRQEAERRSLVVFDATCPLVTKVHRQVVHMRRKGMTIIMIGHAGHPEVEGTMGQCDEDMYLVETVDDVARLRIAADASLAYVTQTTLSIDDAEQIIRALKQRFPDILAPRSDDICYATQNRQDAVRMLAEKSDLIIVVGSRSSSNSNRLREVAELHGVRAYLVDDAEHIDPRWLEDARCVGVTAGASAPEILVRRVVDRLTGGRPENVCSLGGVEECVTFGLPKELRS